MGRKKRTPEEEARRALISELLSTANITSMADIQELFKETIAEFMENGLESELEEKLGYSKYDYRQKAESGSDILSSIANNGVVCSAAKSGCKAIGFARTV